MEKKQLWAFQSENKTLFQKESLLIQTLFSCSLSQDAIIAAILFGGRRWWGDTVNQNEINVVFA